MSLINKEVSDFRTYAFHENDFKFVSREDILGKWSVFFFYPADFTFVCPTELEDLADKYEQFRAIGCEVYSVSTDTHFVHKAWHDASDRIKKINYPMLADPTHRISRDFEVLIETDGLAERGTFIINPEGKIVGYEVTAGNVGRNAEELLRKGIPLCDVIAYRDDVLQCLERYGADRESSLRIMNRIKGGKGLTEADEQRMRRLGIPAWFTDSCKKIGYLFPRSQGVEYAIMNLKLAYCKLNCPDMYDKLSL